MGRRLKGTRTERARRRDDETARLCGRRGLSRTTGRCTICAVLVSGQVRERAADECIDSERAMAGDSCSRGCERVQTGSYSKLEGQIEQPAVWRCDVT